MTDNLSMLADSTALADVFAQPVWLAEHLDDPDVRVVEVDVSRAAYDQGHIPGAILWNAYTDLHHVDYSPLKRSEFEELASAGPALHPIPRSSFTAMAPILGSGWRRPTGTSAHWC